MPDHDDLDPQLEPQLDPQLDHAFAALTRDLAHSPGPGAAAAISTARRHRRTRVGAVAVVAALAVGGGLTMPGLVAAGDGVAADGGSARFDRDALAAATDGWVGDWEDWERYSPWTASGYGTEQCASSQAAVSPSPTSSGVSRFVSHSGASAVLLIEGFSDDASAGAAQDGSLPAPDTCGATTLVDVDGVEVRHDSMPPGAASEPMWLGDVWSARIGDARVELQLATDTGVADDATADRVAQALVAGLRDGWTQSGTMPTEPTEAMDLEKLLPPWPGDLDLEGTLGGWRAATRAASTNVPDLLCLDEQLNAGALVSGGGGSPWGFSHTFAAYDDPQGGEERVATMVEQLQSCTYPEDLQLETLPNGVHLATFDVGGPEGKGALWFAANGDRAGLVGMDGAAEPMPASARLDVADALDEVLHLPREE